MATDQTGNYWNVRGGLHSAEIRLIRRALFEHLQSATAHKARLKRTVDAKAFEHTQAQDAIDALVRLSDRLRKELVQVSDVDRGIHECKTKP